MMEWKFDLITPQTTKVDPAHLEFFRSEALEDAVSALVREDIQNRLDAKTKGSTAPVRVRYYLSGRSSRLEAWDSQKWLAALNPHLNAPKCLEELGSGPIDLGKPMPYLVIEDFNTTGLQGDPMETSDPEESADRNDFYWFVRNVGRTGKKAGDRGRWGLGKIVYPAASSIRSFYCYSVRQEDLRPALIGRSVLAIHAINGSEYHSEGYYALFPDPQYPYFAAPQEDEAAIREFVTAFNVSRTPTDSGLSLVIPFPDDSITLDSLVRTLIHHYFWEILRGTLEVEVADDHKTVSISQATIDDIVMSWPGLAEVDRRVTQHRLEFCRRADRMKLTDPDGYFELSKPGSYGNVRLADQFKSTHHLERAKRRFRDGAVAAAEFVVSVKKKTDVSERDASFLVYLQKDGDLDRADETFIRDGLTIIGESRIREPGIRALVLAEDPTIAEFLGDAENPAHTKWLSTTKHFRGKYSPGNVLLDYIKLSALRLANLLGKVENELLEDLLDDVFGIPDDEQGKASQKTPTGKPGKKKPPTGGVRRKRYLETSRLDAEAGFSVRLSTEATQRPDRIVIRVSYESEHGDPFKLYHPADFDFTDASTSIKIETENTQIVKTGANRIECEPDSDAFSIRVTGFDRNRDLRLDVRPEMDGASGGDAE
jgi:hypothetical protein